MNSDDNFLATSKENLREFLHGLRDRKLGLTWIFEDVGVMHLTKEKIDWLADSVVIIWALQSRLVLKELVKI